MHIQRFVPARLERAYRPNLPLILACQGARTAKKVMKSARAPITFFLCFNPAIARTSMYRNTTLSAMGLTMVAATVGWIALALVLDWGSLPRLLVFIPAWLAALGVLQHREKT